MWSFGNHRALQGHDVQVGSGFKKRWQGFFKQAFFQATVFDVYQTILGEDDIFCLQKD